jgi:hypothetical protein
LYSIYLIDRRCPLNNTDFCLIFRYGEVESPPMEQLSRPPIRHPRRKLVLVRYTMRRWNGAADSLEQIDLPDNAALGLMRALQFCQQMATHLDILFRSDRRPNPGTRRPPTASLTCHNVRLRPPGVRKTCAAGEEVGALCEKRLLSSMSIAGGVANNFTSLHSASRCH